MTPGMLYVTMQPKPGLPPPQFHEWYNNEHGPTRLRLPHIFSNGLRYEAIDDGKEKGEPTYLASYDVTSMSLLETEEYLKLRANRSPREAQTIGQVDVKRYFWDLVDDSSSSSNDENFVPIESQTDSQALGLELIAIQFQVEGEKDNNNQEVIIRKWFAEEHVPAMKKAAAGGRGWLRSRLLRTSTLEPAGTPQSFILLSDFAKSTSKPHLSTISQSLLEEEKAQKTQKVTITSQRAYSLFYIFGPSPRDLSSLSQPSAISSSTCPDAPTITTTTTSTANSSSPLSPSISSTLPLPQDPSGHRIPYRLEGNPSPTAPVLVLTNSLLTSLSMWDPLLSPDTNPKGAAYLHSKYRILRYDTRGRHAGNPRTTPATLDLLTSDLSALLAALRIPRVDVLMGVSLGGATTLSFALAHPEKLASFVACDFNVVSSEANTAAWKERTALAESDGGKGLAQKLAPVTVERWFDEATIKGKPETVKWMEAMVAGNDVEGFREGCKALWDYDLKPRMAGCEVPGLFVAGEGDGKGKLVTAMQGFRGLLGDGKAELKVVKEAGHLPMCENPEGFWEAVKHFL